MSAESCSYDKYLVHHLDLKTYKCTTAATKNSKLYIQLFSPGRSHLTPSFFD